MRMNKVEAMLRRVPTVREVATWLNDRLRNSGYLEAQELCHLIEFEVKKRYLHHPTKVYLFVRYRGNAWSKFRWRC